MSRAKLGIASIVLLALLAGGYMLLRPKGSATHGIPARGGKLMARFDIGAGPILRQRDARWSEETIGGSDETIGAVGCAVCSISMALANYGIAMPPDSLNDLLKKHEGYTERGWLKWEVVANVTGGRAGIDIPNALDHATIDEALEGRTPVIAKVMIRGSISHWVLIVGKDRDEYLIRDPLGDGNGLAPLSGYNSDIYALRLVRPAV